MARLSVVPESGKPGSAATLTEHIEISDAFEQGDPDALEAAIRRHLAAAVLRVNAVNHSAQAARASRLHLDHAVQRSKVRC